MDRDNFHRTVTSLSYKDHTEISGDDEQWTAKLGDVEQRVRIFNDVEESGSFPNRVIK
jgi:hypothetical protein